MSLQKRVVCQSYQLPQMPSTEGNTLPQQVAAIAIYIYCADSSKGKYYGLHVFTLFFGNLSS